MHVATSAVRPTDAPQTSSGDIGGTLDRFRYDDAIVRKFLLAMYVWGIVAFSAGLYVAILLMLPAIRNQLMEAGWLRTSDFLTWLLGIEYFQFGRLRPLHTNAAIFAFAGNAIFAGIYYSTQRLVKARMWSDTLSNLHFWGWQLIIVAAAITLPLGITQSKEYAELEWPIDILIAVVWLGFFGGNFFMTLIHRRERHMYVAIWFYIATIVTVTILHVFNNLVIPTGLFKSYSIYAGVQDALMQWWYGHNAVAFFLTTPFLGLMYYFVPKAANRPVFSYRLSIVHFWSLVFIYIWAGPHHLHYTSLADWASTLGMVFSLMLWMPSWGGMINGLLTLRGAWHRVATEPVLKFFVLGITFYGMSTFEGPLLSIKSVNALSHYTDWTIAHVHSGALGWNGCIAFGMMYYLLPVLFKTKLWSVKLAGAHFWLATLGILFYIIPIYIAGITQGLMWRALTDSGQLQYPDFVETVQRLMPFYYVRVFGGSLFLLGGVLGAVNYYMTWKSRGADYAEEPVITAAPLHLTPIHDPVRPQSELKAVADVAMKLDVYSTLWWHRKWERLPIKFTVYVTIAVMVASLFEFIPEFLIKSNIPTIASVKPYTPLELYGRDIYVGNGCYNCHSQMIRPMLAEVKRYGEYTKPGETIYDHPFQFGSRRIGPDLAREGVVRPDPLWHYLHFENPAQVTANSIMPPYPHLFATKVDFESIPVRVKAMQILGVPYTDAQRASSVDDAKKQANELAQMIIVQGGRAQTLGVKLEDSELIALTAYMRRLGTDLFKPADAPATDAPAAQAAPVAEASRTN
jgi:cytochrome c oxidase cbb3-type subunit I/II